MQKQLAYCALFIFFCLFQQIAFAKLNIISRQEWGANEDLTIEQIEQSAQSMENAQNGEDAEQSETEEKDEEIARVVSNDEGGQKYRWPLQYAKEIKFIVLHHTGLGNELPDDPVREMQNIYYAHAVGRGWGDIGYHFIIDREGRIYEGRKGGNFVIGGHAKPVNKVSIGIALMGNYDEEELPAPMLQSLIDLLKELTKKYKIDPQGSTVYKEKTYPNIHGHEDNSPKRDPGAFFRPKWPLVRKFIAYLRTKEKSAAQVEYDFTKLERREFIITKENKKKIFTIRVKNKGILAWRADTFLENISDAQLPRVFAKLVSAEVKPGELGMFRGKLSGELSPGMHMPQLKLVINESIRPDKTFPQPIMVEAQPKPIRIALSFKDKKPIIKSSQRIALYEGPDIIHTFEQNEDVTIARLKNGKYRVRTKTEKFTLAMPPRLKALNNGILKIVNFENRPAWNPELNDNEYRGVLEIQTIDGRLMIINELPIEDYLKGIAEVSNSDPKEKIKTIIILARSYAAYYRDQKRKFPGKPYDLDDNPDNTQKYLGYGLEKRSPNIAAAVKETVGQLITYQGRRVITPYFNQSDGRTRSALEAWGWTDAPYLQSVQDDFCSTTELKGHGVGVSGCGATQLAKDGKTAEEIIKYYYSGVEITDKK